MRDAHEWGAQDGFVGEQPAHLEGDSETSCRNPRICKYNLLDAKGDERSN
jgi:hypothetical protein